MRVRLLQNQTLIGEYFSLTEASKILGQSVYNIKKYYEVIRLHERGYWETQQVSKEWLKFVAIKRAGRLLITD